MNIISKFDYRKYERINVHTTIRKDLYTNLRHLSVEWRQPATKMLDIALDMILNDDTLLKEFSDKLKTYR